MMKTKRKEHNREENKRKGKERSRESNNKRPKDKKTKKLQL
jgi:hypothetical protein